MKRRQIAARDNWRQKLEQVGFSFHSVGGTYWNEGVFYEFSAAQIDRLEAAANQLQEMAIAAAQHVIDANLYHKLGIAARFVPLIEASWERDDPSIYGRFDLAYDGGDTIKLLEYNADTPTALIEASVAQWTWLEDVFPRLDQFNSIHEKLVGAFAGLRQQLPADVQMHFTSVRECEEDFVTIEYLRDTATQAGLFTKHLFIEDIGFSETARAFFDLENEPIRFLFKLYPWEWMVAERFGEKLLLDTMRVCEPAWKMLLSNKGILPVLWQLYPGHPLLLDAYFEEGRLQGRPHVRKPLLSREGASIVYLDEQGHTHQTDGDYGAEGFIYQLACPLPCFDGNYPVVGAWIVNGEAAGIGIREDDTPITQNTSRFVPHCFHP